MLLRQMPWQCGAKMCRWDVGHPNSCTSFDLHTWLRFGTCRPRTRLSHISHVHRSCNPRRHSHNMLCGRTLNLWNWSSWCRYKLEFLVRSSPDRLRKFDMIPWSIQLVGDLFYLFIFYFLIFDINPVRYVPLLWALPTPHENSVGVLDRDVSHSVCNCKSHSLPFQVSELEFHECKSHERSKWRFSFSLSDHIGCLPICVNYYNVYDSVCILST